MSRFEANGERSMEEILASIREIIAEDSRGPRSRPMPQRPSPTPAAQRGFMSRDAFMGAPLPVAKPEPVPARNETYFSPIVPQNEPAPASSRLTRDAISPAARPLPHDERAGASRSVPASDSSESDDSDIAKLSGATNAKSDTRSQPQDDANPIDAQIAGLLGDDGEGPSSETVTDVKASVAQDASPMVGVKEEPQKPGEPASAVLKVVAADAEAPSYPPAGRETSDPFSFDLGPSPFSAQSVSRTTQTEKSADEVAASLGKVERAISNVRDFAARDVPSTAPASAPPRRDAQAVPSVAATLGPYSTLEPLSASFDRPGPDRPAFERPSAPVDRPSFPSSPYAQAMGVPAASEPPLPAASLMATPAPSHMSDRALEDTVADLLRPMLKTWLAENMPKIVERALRREINERLLLSQKSAAE